MLKNISLVCKMCGRTFEVKPWRKDTARFCSRSCKSKYIYDPNKFTMRGRPAWNKGIKTGLVPRSAFKKGQRPHNYKGSRFKEGYVIVALGNNKYIKRARKIMQDHLGRPLETSEIVHHLNGIKDDDRLANLVVVTRARHTSIHHKNKNQNTDCTSVMVLDA